MTATKLYVLWGNYYNPTLDAYIKEPLAFYLAYDPAYHALQIMTEREDKIANYYITEEKAYQ